MTTIALPFSYTLYDQTFTSINVSSNGNAQFTTTATDFTNAVPAVDHPQLHDLPVLGRPAHRCKRGCSAFPGGTCGIFTSVTGTAPNRIFNIEWRTDYFAETTMTANYELRLYEGQKRFDVIYGTATTATQRHSRSAEERHRL